MADPLLDLRQVLLGHVRPPLRPPASGPVHRKRPPPSLCGVARGGQRSGPYFRRTTRDPVGGRTDVRDGAPGPSGGGPERARDEVARARDIPLETSKAIIAGIFIGWLGIATKAA